MCKRKKIYVRTLFRHTNKKMTGHQQKPTKIQETPCYSQLPTTTDISYSILPKHRIWNQNTKYIYKNERRHVSYGIVEPHRWPVFFRGPSPSRCRVSAMGDGSGFQLSRCFSMTRCSVSWDEFRWAYVDYTNTRSICSTNFENPGKCHLQFAYKWRNEATDPREMLPVAHKSVPKIGQIS